MTLRLQSEVRQVVTGATAGCGEKKVEVRAQR
jgi:hypothetical protein